MTNTFSVVWCYLVLFGGVWCLQLNMYGVRQNAILVVVVMMILISVYCTTAMQEDGVPHRHKRSNRQICRPNKVKKCLSFKFDGQMKRFCIYLPKLEKNCVPYHQADELMNYLLGDFSRPYIGGK